MQDTVGLDDLRKDTNFESNGVLVGDFLAGLEAKRKQNLQLVPTDDEEVKLKLREFGQPITYFGEDKGDRRDRLIRYVVENNIDLTGTANDEAMEDADDNDIEDEEFYTPGSYELVEARKFMTRYSLENSQRRIEKQIQDSKVDTTEQLLIRRNEIKKYKPYALTGSQPVSTRPVSQVAINPKTNQIISGSWAGELKLLNEDLDILKEFESMEGKIGGLDWSPTNNEIFISSANSLKLYNTSSDVQATYTGHENRIVRSKFHPSGRYIASASYDLTWRLWDVETQQQLLLQEGHSKEIYTIGFQKDGSLLASAGLDAMGYVWDLRTGTSIMTLDGHIKPIYGLDWRDNGYQLATGGADGLIKVWDLRMKKVTGSVPAHNSIISEVKFHDNVLVSSSYDHSIKIFSCDNWISINELQGHSDKVMSVDVSDGLIVSSGWDRSVKKWCV